MAANLHNGPGASSLDAGRTDYDQKTNDRLADALAITWGFGFEYAVHISEGGSIPWSSDAEGYLDSEILCIHETLNWRQEEQDKRWEAKRAKEQKQAGKAGGTASGGTARKPVARRGRAR